MTGADSTASSPGRRQFHQDGVLVPFIAPWSGEEVKLGRIVRHQGRGGTGIRYADEDLVTGFDRRGEALWVRVPAARGKGRARLGAVHALRQRLCMSRMLCQICGGSTCDRADERHVFLMGGDEPIAEGERTGSPPVHETCAVRALRECPHLRRSRVAALVEYAFPWGIAGVVHDPRTLQPRYSDEPDGLTLVAYDDPRLRWTLAMRDINTLHGCTAVDLDALVTVT